LLVSTITINRGEWTAVQFSITDSTSGLAGKRVTWSVGPRGDAPALHKVSALPGSSADVTITSQTPGAISGVINLAVADFAALPNDSYDASLWVDSGAADDRCVTPGGVDMLVITRPVARA
jgi:hypothetical protein